MLSCSVMSNSCSSIDCCPPGSSIWEILQATVLERVAIFFSRGSSWPRNGTWIPCTAGRFLTDWAENFSFCGEKWIKGAELEEMVLGFLSHSWKGHWDYSHRYSRSKKLNRSLTGLKWRCRWGHIPAGGSWGEPTSLPSLAQPWVLKQGALTSLGLLPGTQRHSSLTGWKWGEF